MDFGLSKPQQEIKKAAWEFARGKFAKEMILEQEKAGEFPRSILEKAGELGFIGSHFDEAYGGAGLGLFETVLICESFCRRDSTMGMALMTSAYGSECLLRFGEGILAERFLPGIAEGRMISTAALLDPEVGYDLSASRTTGRKEAGEWIINGSKAYVPFGDRADCYILLCATDPEANPPQKGLSMILVESDRSGIHTAGNIDRLGARLIPACEVRFEEVAVPLSNLIGTENMGYSQLTRFVTENRIQVAAMALGAAQGTLDRAVSYVKDRAQFGKKLASFPVTRHKVAEMGVQIEGARYLTYSAALRFDQGKATEKDAASAKLFATRCAMAVADAAVQLLGGYGYMNEYEVERFYRDAKHMEIFQGPPSAQKDIIGDAILG
jgi:alkylation response protein AidB-like acyl-CoA dehydrogenase